jgi:chemotaxis protein MotB
MFCGLGALGYYAGNLHAELGLARSQETKVKEDLTACRGDAASCKELLNAAQKKYDEGLEDAAEMKAQLENTRDKLDQLQDEKQEAKKELAQLKRFTKKFDRMISAGKLSITFRRGRMVVNMPAKVLFASGSAELSEEGRKSLSQVARILRKVKGKRFVVAGHTDNVRIAKAKYESNWELSAARAVVVTRALIKSGLTASRLAASGFAQHDPIASNNHEDGRQKNRRIEIIVEPYLKEISSPKDKTKQYKKSKDIPKANRESKKYKINKQRN